MVVVDTHIPLSTISIHFLRRRCKRLSSSSVIPSPCDVNGIGRGLTFFDVVGTDREVESGRAEEREGEGNGRGGGMARGCCCRCEWEERLAADTCMVLGESSMPSSRGGTRTDTFLRSSTPSSDLHQLQQLHVMINERARLFDRATL